MATEEKKKKTILLGIPAGLVLGLCVVGYILSLKGNHDEMIAFPLIFSPMLATLGIAAIVNLVFWLATGHFPQKDSIGSPTNEERLLAVAQRPQRLWLVTCYRCLQPVAMAGAGYIVLCPIIGLIILK